MLDSCKKPQKQKKPSTCNVRKFKFPACDEKPKRQEEIIEDTRCPPSKKKRPIIDDCPGNKEEKGSSSFEFCGKDTEYNLSGEKKDGSVIKIPKIDLTILNV